MAGNNALLICAVPVVRQQKIIDKANARVEQSAIAGGAIPGDCALQHVANAIKLVAGGLGIVEHAQRFSIALVIGIQVSAGFLRGDHVANHRCGGGAKLWLIRGLQRKSYRLGPFVDVGIGVNGADLRG